MSSDLDSLIYHYQREVKRLKTLIKEHKEMHFYEEVILDSKALGNAARELQRLLNLKNPNHSKILSKKDLISSIEKIEEKLCLDKMRKISFMDYEVNNLKKEIKKLSKEKSGSNFETQFLDEEIYNLLDSKIKQIKLKIQSHSNWLFIDITANYSNQLKVEFWMGESSEKYFLSRHDVVKELQFLYDVTTKKFTSIYNLASIKNILQFKEFLARLIYGLKPDLELENKFYIEVR